MTITAAQLCFCLSGGAANSNVNLSIGGTSSTSTISDATLNNLFDDVSAAEATSGDSEYRGIFLYLSNSSDTLTNARVWISASTTAAGDEFYLVTDSKGLCTGVRTGHTMSSCTDEGTTASGMGGTWRTVSEYITLGNMTPTSSYPVWIKRSVSAGASSYANNSATVAWDGETA
jgi:hypothetical protein